MVVIPREHGPRYGPRYGYIVNVSKTWLVVKEPSHVAAVALFQDTGIKITTDGRPLLGAHIGTNQYTSDFISQKVEEWSHEIDALANIARVHPHPAYTAYTHGQANKWVYQARVSEDCSDHFQKLESVIRTKLLPAVCNRAPSDVERELIGLPTRLGGLEVHNPAQIAKSLDWSAVIVTEPLVDHALQHQNNRHNDDDDRQADPAFEEALGHQRDAVKQARQAWDTGVQEKPKSLCERLGHDSTAALAMR